MLEMALVAPVVIVLIMVVLELGFAIHANINIAWAAREGARAGAVYLYQQDCSKRDNDDNREGGTGPCISHYTDNIRDTVGRSAGVLRGFDKVNHVTISYTPTSSTTWETRSGDLVNVEISYPYRFLTDMLTNQTLTLRARGTARIEP